MSEAEKKKSTVPKFSSFKPKTATPTPPNITESRNRKDDEDEDVREKRPRRESRHHHDRAKHRPEHRHHHRKGSHSRIQEQPLVEKPDMPRALDEKATESNFFFDKKGDPLIRRYGGNDRSRVPIYRRGYRGRVLGSDGYLVVHRDGPQERFSIRMPGEGSSTLRDRALFQAKVHRGKPKRIRLRDETNETESRGAEEEFVPLSTSTKRRRAEDSESSGNERPSYRSIEGKAKAHEFSDSDIDFDSDSQEEIDLDMDDPFKQRSVQLSRLVKEHPEDIEAWLELIKHQDVLLNAGQSLDRDVTKAEVHSFAEIKISMFESALAQAKKPEDEERLLLGLMLEGSRVWSTSKLDNRWEEVAKKHDSSFCLWKSRVDHKLTSLSTFQYTEIKAMHINRLRAISKQAKVSASPDPGHSTNCSDTSRYEQMILVFLRATRFAYSAGFRELAIAAWQALLELNLQRPSNFDDRTPSQILDSFKDFWEDESPRIGEKSALGWEYYVRANGAVDLAEPWRDESSVQGSRDVYKSWGATERLRATNARTPARATDDVPEEDPYRVVMFSDIEEMLFIIPSGVVPTIWKQLVDAFLLFCCLPPTFLTSEWTRAAENDMLVVGSMSLFENDVLLKPNEPDVMDESKKTPGFRQDGSRFAASPDLLFAGSDWFSLFSGWTITSKTLDGPVDLAWLANALRLLASSKGLGELAEYSLSIEAINDPSNIKKRAKAFIKQDPTNLRLYNAYALAEVAYGRQEVGQQAVTSAIGLISTSNSSDGLMLWRTWAWMDLNAGNNAQAIVRLCAATDGALRDAVVATPSQLLKAHQSLLASLESQIFSGQLDDAIVTAECLALLVYLTSQEGSEPTSEAQGSISAAMERIWTMSSEFCTRGQSKSPTHERLLQAGARLLYHHASRGPFRRVYLREQLSQFIELFPRNTMFLSLFSWASTTFGIDDPVRDILRKVAFTNGNDCISNRIFAVRYELQKGNVHSTQAAFERALDTPACRSNPDIWRCYIKFSYARKQLRAKAKDVFFRGLRHCPWSKDLALEAYTTLINAMDEFELRSVFNTMSSKGLRVHVDLDEFVAKHKETRAMHG
ncbi:NRDE-2, necessary for RNA interference-domain-containing protein [Colletotrichum navitas]|uniref:NRDE-2, necessary for RNA interference-domain-containing protein n=1 Tax=Colletotrichum navitas TaxID=681940 RepID=A0AAD8VB86_9PEZI|nr:NRDE-2, necessary for RNA interference-domain-containing protein [Colletotrichum navitas]KAK1598701.1 NRDE-2, necessary for RNA interference-domain-containing protein [Colletotrichum navitas]